MVAGQFPVSAIIAQVDCFRAEDSGATYSAPLFPARGRSSVEVSAARETGAGKTSTAAPQNGQDESRLPPNRYQGDLSLTRECCWRMVLRKDSVEIANSSLKVTLQHEC